MNKREKSSGRDSETSLKKEGKDAELGYEELETRVMKGHSKLDFRKESDKDAPEIRKKPMN